MISKIKSEKTIILIIGIIIVFIFVVTSFKQEKNEEIVENLETEEFIKVEENTGNLIQVDIKGAVKKPGVYSLENNMRVKDAIEKAGGLLESADASTINLSRKLVDEMVIVIYTNDEIRVLKEKEQQNVKLEETCMCPKLENDACIKDVTTNYEQNNNTNSGLISINNAGISELQTLPGIGEKKAQAIISYRETNGLFKSIDEIKNIDGIGASTFEKIKEFITL